MQWDKRVFEWIDPDTGQAVPEYPIDEQRARHGRIVGEVEIDHVPVHYQKDSFEEDHPLWHEVIHSLRGESPLRRNVARRRQMPVNDSLLANIYRGYNRTRTEEGGRRAGTERTRRDPWKRDLIINQDVAKDYYGRFLAGQVEYQSDAKWYEWMQAADRQMNQPNPPDPNDPTTPDSLIPPNDPIEPPLSEQDKLKQSGELDEELSGSYGFEPAREVVVNVYRVTENLWIDVRDVKVGVPIKVFRAPDGTMDCFYNLDHPRFDGDDGTEVAELLSGEVSLTIRERFYDRFPFSYVYGPVRANRRQDATTGPTNVLIQKLIDDLITTSNRRICWRRFSTD